jgi:hypothetical protein
MQASPKVGLIPAAVATLALLTAAVLLVPACDQKAAPTSRAATAQTPVAGSKSSIMKVAVLADGSLLVDGVAADLSKLDVLLARLAADKGEVWYYRENPAGEPPPIAIAALDLITKHKVRMSMSTKADYSDTLDAEGTTHPRK